MKLPYIAGIFSVATILTGYADEASPPSSPRGVETKLNLEAHKFESRIGEFRKKIVPIVNVRADWDEQKSDKKVYEAEKGWALFSYAVKERSKSDRANYSVDKRAAGSDFEAKETVEKIAQELTDYAKDKGDDKSKERLEKFFRYYSDFYQHIKTSHSRLEFSYDIKGSGKFYDRYGAWLNADWEIVEGRIITPDEASLFKDKIKQYIDGKQNLDDFLANPETQPLEVK